MRIMAGVASAYISGEHEFYVPQLEAKLTGQNFIVEISGGTVEVQIYRERLCN